MDRPHSGEGKHQRIRLLRIIPDNALLVQIREYYPDATVRFDDYINSMPHGDCPLTAPFTGLVINMQSASLGHRDEMDDTICAVITFGDYSDGDIVFYELGLVVSTRPGDAVIFLSSDITHFNLHFRGRRGSLVLHVDSAFRKQAKDTNGWKEKMV